MGAVEHDLRTTVIIYHFLGNFQVWIQVTKHTCGDHIIQSHLGFSLFNILLVGLTGAMLLWKCVCLLDFLCLVTLSIIINIPYSSEYLSGDRFMVVLFHFLFLWFPLALPHCFGFVGKYFSISLHCSSSNLALFYFDIHLNLSVLLMTLSSTYTPHIFDNWALCIC